VTDTWALVMADVVGLLHPGEMGAAIGAVLRQRGIEVLWASDGRSGATAARARTAGLIDAGTVTDLARRSDVVLSVCPPHAAAHVAVAVGDFRGVFVDANAISPATTRRIGQAFERFVDGGIVGGPPSSTDGPRLYLSGADAGAVTPLFAETPVDARVLSDRIGDASALKMVYAAWTKGTAALLLAIREVARSEGVADALSEEWRESLPELEARVASAERSAAAKGWRWVAEMEEIAATFEAAGAPPGFHEAAADVFRRA
jgi:3-hydroxyisobutyrate dehydrogenase-like beta-hydroxyacid dehydrogenase